MKPAGASYPFTVNSATDQDGNTSEFSNPRRVVAP
jgi:hypothetical protein